MSTTGRLVVAVLFSCLLVAGGAVPARAGLYRLAAAGTITANASSDATIAVGTPWAFELTYDTAAPDLDFELSGSADPTFGRYTNTCAPPAMTFFHYKAGSYEVTLDDPADFGEFSSLDITFTSINGIDINLFAPDFFPPLAGGAVSFHADFAAFSTPPIFTSDALPTNTAIGPGSLVDSSVTLLPPAGFVTGSNLTSLTLTAILPGDYNQSGAIDAADYTVWRDHLAHRPARCRMTSMAASLARPNTTRGRQTSGRQAVRDQMAPRFRRCRSRRWRHLWRLRG